MDVHSEESQGYIKEKQQYQKVTSEKRKILIQKVIFEKHTLISIAKLLRINLSTSKSIIRKYRMASKTTINQEKSEEEVDNLNEAPKEQQNLQKQNKLQKENQEQKEGDLNEKSQEKIEEDFERVEYIPQINQAPVLNAYEPQCYFFSPSNTSLPQFYSFSQSFNNNSLPSAMDYWNIMDFCWRGTTY